MNSKYQDNSHEAREFRCYITQTILQLINQLLIDEPQQDPCRFALGLKKQPN